jgi:C1A family cysteine protease
VTLAKYHRVKDRPDARDFIYVGHLKADAPTPPQAADLRPVMPAVYDQGQLGSCTANAIVAALESDEIVQKENLTPLSRLFVYWNERNMEHDVGQDGGAQIRDGIKSVALQGACAEQFFPYVEETFKNKPSFEAYTDASNHKALLYEAVPQTIEALTHVLGVEKRPVVFGIEVYASFEADSTMQTGIVPMPSTATEEYLGGHAILIVGYDLVKQTFLVRNSWGPDVGIGGYFEFPAAFILNPALSSDFWAITKIS